MDPVAMPSAAMAAASRASSQASTVRRTKPEYEGSGGGVFTLAVLIGKTALSYWMPNPLWWAQSASSWIVVHNSCKKHNSRRFKAGYKAVNFSLSPNEKIR
jgi:hypothetical protein